VPSQSSVQSCETDVRFQIAQSTSLFAVYSSFINKHRYMKFATAAYGDAMIRAAEMDVLGKFDSRLSSVDKISEHTGIPEENIVAMDVDYDGDVSAVMVAGSLIIW